MRTVNLEEAQAKLPKLIHDLLQGEELVIPRTIIPSLRLPAVHVPRGRANPVAPGTRSIGWQTILMRH